MVTRSWKDSKKFCVPFIQPPLRITFAGNCNKWPKPGSWHHYSTIVWTYRPHWVSPGCAHLWAYVCVHLCVVLGNFIPYINYCGHHNPDTELFLYHKDNPLCFPFMRTSPDCSLCLPWSLGSARHPVNICWIFQSLAKYHCKNLSNVFA